MDSTPEPPDEITRFLAGIPGGDEPALPDPHAPEVVFPGVLTLTREQEEALVSRCFSRKETLELNLGVDRARMNETDYAMSATLDDLRYFYGRRRLYEMLYHKRVDWRLTAYGAGSIYHTSNLHLPVVRRILQQQIARASNYFFATEPWFNASPQGPADDAAAQKVNRYAQWKFRRAGVRAVFEQAVEKAMIRGEAVVKTASVRKSRFYEDVLTILIDPATGEPLVASDGDYIQESDTYQPAVREEVDPTTGEVVQVPETNEDGTPIMVLSRAPDTLMPPGEPTYDTRVVTRERVVYAGPEAEVLYYLDFLCPEDAPNVQEADFVAHLYDMPATQIAQAYLDRGRDADPKQKTKILELLRRAAGARVLEPAASGGPRAEDNSQSPALDFYESAVTGRLPIMECYVTMDVNGDGRPEEVMVILDRETKKPLFYDYTDRVTPNGQRPFHVVRVNPVDGRWYGNSQVDLFWDLQMFIDLTMNRWNFSQSTAARVDFWNPEAVIEGDGNPNLKLGGGRTYRLKPNRTADEALQSKYLTDIKGADLQTQIEFFLQIATTMSGVSSANDAALANLDTTKLATGVKNIEKSGQELFAPLLSHLEPGLASACEDLLRLLVYSMDGPEVYQYFEGETRMDEIKPDDIRDMDFLVEMELTRYKTEQQLQQGLHALDVIDRYFTQIPELQTLTAPIYQNVLKLFGIDHADRIIVPGLVAPPSINGVDPAGAAASIAPKPTGQSPANL
jgi:hypothetical protein